MYTCEVLEVGFNITLNAKITAITSILVKCILFLLFVLNCFWMEKRNVVTVSHVPAVQSMYQQESNSKFIIISFNS